MELCDLSAFEIARMVREKQVTTVAVTESALARVAAVDGKSGTLEHAPLTDEDRQRVHAFITLTADLARQQAAQVDARIAAGEDPGILAGVPFTVKDIFCVQDTPTTAASKILANFVAPYTATPVERMTAAGAVMIGKVNLDEFTFGSSNESSAFQPSPRNPWNPSRVPGGSSGGSTASVAAGEAALALGTDTAGSIRQPAAFCGVVGVKPTYGRVSRYGLIAFASSLDCPGPVARDITDAALMMQVIAGADPHDATAARVEVPDYLAELQKDLRGIRVGLSPDYFRIVFPDDKTGGFDEQRLPAEIEQAVLDAAQALARQGAEIVENVPMPNTRYGIPAYFVISRVEAAANLHRFDGVKYGYRTGDVRGDLRGMYRRTRGAGFGKQPKLRILMGMYVSAAQFSAQYYQKALKVRTMIRRDFDQAFDAKNPQHVDVLLTPTTPTTAFAMDAVYGNSVLMQYADQLTVPANHAGVPGVSLPGGLDGSGLPIGIQLLGPDFSEALLLQVGRAFERETAQAEWRKMKPAVLR